MVRGKSLNSGCGILKLLRSSKVKLQSPDRDIEAGIELLPLYHNRSGTRRSQRRRSDLWVHCIPLLVLLSILTLWWFSYPVNLEIRDGRITAIHRVEEPDYGNDTRVDFAFLASDTLSHEAVEYGAATESAGYEVDNGEITTSHEIEMPNSPALITPQDSRSSASTPQLVILKNGTANEPANAYNST